MVPKFDPPFGGLGLTQWKIIQIERLTTPHSYSTSVPTKGLHCTGVSQCASLTNRQRISIVHKVTVLVRWQQPAIGQRRPVDCCSSKGAKMRLKIKERMGKTNIQNDAIAR